MVMHRREFIKLAAKSTAGLIVVPSLLFLRPPSAPRPRATASRWGLSARAAREPPTCGCSSTNRACRQIVGICDVDRERREIARKTVETAYAAAAPSGSFRGCTTTGDFRELLARPDIDAVLIAVPDHWHALDNVIHAARAGKDIYAEKPFSLTIPEGRAMVKAIQESGAVCQIGSQQRSSAEFQRCVELARNGFLGELTRVKVGLPSSMSVLAPGPIDHQKVPPGFDYNFWLGPAPMGPLLHAAVLL